MWGLLVAYLYDMDLDKMYDEGQNKDMGRSTNLFEWTRIKGKIFGQDFWNNEPIDLEIKGIKEQNI